jgi:capsular exopolysaccharide synthesis family protein
LGAEADDLGMMRTMSTNSPVPNDIPVGMAPVGPDMASVAPAWGPYVAPGVAPPPPIVNAPPNGLALLKALRRRWQVAAILAPLAALLVATLIYFFAPTGRYTAKAVLELNPRSPSLGFRPSAEEISLDNFRQTQIALIKNQKVINAALRDPKLSQLPTLKQIGDPLAWLEESLTFNAPGNAQVLEVKLQGRNPEDIRLLLNAIVKNYISEFISSEQVVRSARLEALRRFEAELDSELKRDEAARRQFFRQGAGAVNTAAVQLAFLRTDMERLKSRMRELEDEISELETREKVLQNKDPSRLPLDDKIFQQFFAQDGVLKQLEDDLQTETSKVINAKALGYREDVVARLEENRRRIEEQIKARKLELRPQAESYWRQRAATDFVKESTSLNETLEIKRSLLERLRKELDRQKQMYEDLAKNQIRLDESALNSEATAEMLKVVRTERRRLEQEVNNLPRVRELEEARLVPGDPSDRRIKMSILGGGLAFCLVLAGLSLWEFHSRRVESVDQIVYGLGLPLVGTVPAMPKQSLLGLAGLTNEEQIQQWRFALHEAVATARTVLLNASRTSNLRMVMITSAMAGEGKTSLSTQLAVSLAMAGKRTLLLDFDLRNPSAHRLLGMTHAPGWSEILRGDLNVADAIRPTHLENLFFIPAGDCDPVALKSLVQEELGQILSWLRSQFDFVIVDTCPVLPVVDALLLGRHMDGVIFSVLNEVSQIPKIYIATQRVAQLGIRTLGAVVSGIRDDKYGYGGYGYGQRKGRKTAQAGASPSANGTSGTRAEAQPNPHSSAAIGEGPKVE